MGGMQAESRCCYDSEFHSSPLLAQLRVRSLARRRGTLARRRGKQSRMRVHARTRQKAPNELAAATVTRPSRVAVVSTASMKPGACLPYPTA